MSGLLRNVVFPAELKTVEEMVNFLEDRFSYKSLRNWKRATKKDPKPAPKEKQYYRGCATIEAPKDKQFRRMSRLQRLLARTERSSDPIKESRKASESKPSKKCSPDEPILEYFCKHKDYEEGSDIWIATFNRELLLAVIIHTDKDGRTAWARVAAALGYEDEQALRDLWGQYHHGQIQRFSETPEGGYPESDKPWTVAEVQCWIEACAAGERVSGLGQHFPYRSLRSIIDFHALHANACRLSRRYVSHGGKKNPAGKGNVPRKTGAAKKQAYRKKKDQTKRRGPSNEDPSRSNNARPKESGMSNQDSLPNEDTPSGEDDSVGKVGLTDLISAFRTSISPCWAPFIAFVTYVWDRFIYPLLRGICVGLATLFSGARENYP